VCEAATLAARDAGHFAQEGVSVELVRVANPQAAVAAVQSGHADAASSLIYPLLGLIEHGADLRISAGLHGGCLRLVAGTATGITEIEHVRGATIATDRLGGPAMTFISSLLVKRGIDAGKDVAWRAYPPAGIAAAIAGGDAQVLAAGDPVAYALLRARTAVEVVDNGSAGTFFCDRGIAHSHQCYVVLRGELARNDKKTAAALTRGWVNAARWVGHHLPQAAHLEAAGGYVDVDAPTATAILSTYGWHPSADWPLEEIELLARDFVRAGLLGRTTDPERLAETAYADVYNTWSE
jgi:NitT/TauT family transport system substrate-binding protein